MAGCNSCDGVSESGADREDPLFRRVLWLALVGNGAMFAVELVASFISGSVSLQADALDFFGDAVNYGITLFVLGMALHVRAKAALFKSATMAVFGLWVIGSAVYRATTGAVPDAAVMGVVGMLALLVNLGVAVMLAAGGVFATATGWPDILVAALIAGLNLSAAAHVLRQAVGELQAERDLTTEQGPRVKDLSIERRPPL